VGGIYHALDDLPSTLDVFPLTGVLLLPRGNLPLNVFEPRYLALALDAKGDREAAIEELLELARRERKWNDEAARKHLVTLFEAMGPADPRTVAARRKLSSILFS